MYSDPSQVRSRAVRLYFNDNEADLINAWVKYTGAQKAAFLREMLLEQARLDMGLNSAYATAANEVLLQASVSA